MSVAVPGPAVTRVPEARATTRRVARTFSLACRLLPADIRDDVYLLYLFFRTLDDLVDERHPAAASHVEAAAAWGEDRLGPTTPETLLLEDLAGRYPIPRDAIVSFCAGMQHDLNGRELAREEDVDRYCYQVAGTVGQVMCALLGVRRAEPAAAAAAALGMAMQRTNILRDIDEDRAAGRCYLAAETVASFGPPVPGNRADLLRDGIARADALYAEGLAGLPELRRGRRAVGAAAAMYQEILRQIERDGLGRQAGRAVVPPGRRIAVGVRGASLAPRAGLT